MKHIAGQDTGYWNNRFASAHWSNNGGNYQSLAFMSAILNTAFDSPFGDDLRAYANIKAEPDGMISYRPFTVSDYGCAEGDGTAVLQSVFPAGTVWGYDWSTEAVYRARERWPTLKFGWGDITNPIDPSEIIITSHTVEHLADPAAAVNRLKSFCRLLIVAVPPISHHEDGGHNGAVPLERWVADTGPNWRGGFNTVRFVDGSAWVEGTEVIVYAGNLTP